MQRIKYLHLREKEVAPRIEANYFSTIHRLPEARCAELWAFRSLCVDRIYKLAAAFHTAAETPFVAVRMMDRCLTVSASGNITFCVMSVLSVACFDISHKCIDDDAMIALSTLMHYAQNEMNESPITAIIFQGLLRATEIGILKGTQGQPIMPTPFDYIREAVPEWSFQEMESERRGASLLCSAFVYAAESAAYTSLEIAVAAVLLAKKPTTEFGPELKVIVVGVSDERTQAIQLCMTRSVERLLSLECDTGFGRFFPEYRVAATQLNK